MHYAATVSLVGGFYFIGEGVSWGDFIRYINNVIVKRISSQVNSIINTTVLLCVCDVHSRYFRFNFQNLSQFLHDLDDTVSTSHLPS